jgi:CHAT domain-containing protein
MWPVETTTAGRLTTGMFRKWKKMAPTKAGAMQQSIIDLIDSPGLLDGQNGKVVASYAHPFFWAPFVVVGDGR